MDAVSSANLSVALDCGAFASTLGSMRHQREVKMIGNLAVSNMSGWAVKDAKTDSPLAAQDG